jgi:hypothetical protein
VQKNNNKHWSDNFGWTMAKFMHQEVLKVIRTIVGATHYVVFSYDEVFTVDNQCWLFMHCYVMQNWVKIPILISLDRVIKGSRGDNLTKVIMEALMICGGVPKNQIAQKLICFGANGVDVFQGIKSGVTKQIKENYALHSIGVHCMAHHTNLEV